MSLRSEGVRGGREGGEVREEEKEKGGRKEEIENNE